MIVTRTPFRITLGGGGTDLPSYYSQFGGFIFAVGINKYMYINVNHGFDEKVRVKYSKSEIVNCRDEVQHDIARESLKMLDINHGIEIVSISDIPAGTGLGSSSCYSIGLLHALHTYKRDYIDLYNLAETACKLEIDILKAPVGKQDQYMAAFGGLTVMDIDKDGKVKVRNAKVSPFLADDLNRNLLIFYTKVRRSAADILKEQSSNAKEGKKNVVESMHYIKELGYKILEAIESGNITDVGLLFDKHWEYKKKISTKMSNPQFDEIYNVAKENGALGGKISGAGGGGFFLFYLENNYEKFIQKMKKMGLEPLRYRFDFEGTKVVANLRDGTAL